MAEKSKIKREIGRPKGSDNRNIENVKVVIGRCPRCGSTRRGKYVNTRKYQGGLTKAGILCTQVIIRRCQCTDCGQWRDERSYEFPSRKILIPQGLSS